MSFGPDNVFLLRMYCCQFNDPLMSTIIIFSLSFIRNPILTALRTQCLLANVFEFFKHYIVHCVKCTKDIDWCCKTSILHKATCLPPVRLTPKPAAKCGESFEDKISIVNSWQNLHAYPM